MLWAHNLHLLKGSVPSSRHAEQGPRLGSALEQALGPDYFAIGTDFSAGKPQWQPARDSAPCGSVEGELARRNGAGFILNIRSARHSGASMKWIDEPRMMRVDTPSTDYKAIPSQAWDAIVFVRQITPVRVSQN